MPKVVAIKKSVNNKTPEPSLEEFQLPELKKNQTHIKISHASVTKYDTSQLEGIVPLNELQTKLGFCAIGRVVESTGENFTSGQLVITATSPHGGLHATDAIVDDEYLFPIPDGYDPKALCAILFNAIAAHYLTKRSFIVREGTAVVVHGAHGAVGRKISQMANTLGSYVIGTCTSSEQFEELKKNGCYKAFDTSSSNWHQTLVQEMGGFGVNAVYDAIGQQTYQQSQSLLMPGGMYVAFGNIAGDIEQLDTSYFRKKALYFTSPSIFLYKKTKIQTLSSYQDIIELLKIKLLQYEKYTVFKSENLQDAYEYAKNNTINVLLQFGDQ